MNYEKDVEDIANLVRVRFEEVTNEHVNLLEELYILMSKGDWQRAADSLQYELSKQRRFYPPICVKEL